MDSVKGTGKTAEEAINDALLKLGVTAERAEVTIETEGSKGLFGIGAKPFVAVAVKKDGPCEKAIAFVGEVCSLMNIDVKIDDEMSDEGLKITLHSDKMGVLIGYRGETLDSLQYITNLVVNRGREDYMRITLDSENYRTKRQQTLERLARKYASRALTSGKIVSFEPMKPYERRVLHAALQDDEGVVTYSEGDEPYRRVVIKPRR